MPSPKQKFVWICRAADELSAVFSTQEMAREFCDLSNRAAEATQQEMQKLGFKNYERQYFTWTRRELRRGID